MSRLTAKRTAITAGAALMFCCAVAHSQEQRLRKRRAARPRVVHPVRIQTLSEEAPPPSAAPAPRSAPPELYTPGPDLPPPYAVPPPYAYPPSLFAVGPYGFGGFGGFRPLGRYDQERQYEIGRQTERYRQQADEARRAVEARRRQRRETGRDSMIERPGPYPVAPESAGGVYAPSADPADAGAAPYPYDPFNPSYYYGARLENERSEANAYRKELTLMSYEDMLTQGAVLFRAGQYGSAARLFAAAADKHQRDAGSRIHAAQALVAVGMYKSAVGYVRRAVSLQPLLLYTPINLQADYGNKADYDRHIAALVKHCDENPTDVDAWLLLAFEQLLSPEPQRCAQAINRVHKIARRDRLGRRLIRAAAPLIAGQRSR